MRKLFIIVLVIFLMGCTITELDISSSQYADTANQQHIQGEIIPNSTAANDVAIEHAQSTEPNREIVSIELFSGLIPAESTYVDLYEILRNAGVEDTGAAATGVAWRSTYATERGNLIEIDSGYTKDLTIISVWHTLPDIHSWLKEKSISNCQLGTPSNAFSTTDLTDLFQQSSSYSNLAYLEQFVDIVPGESTVLDIRKIIEESKICIDSIDTSVWGWKIRFPTDNPSNSIIVDMDSDFTVLRIGHTIADRG